MNTLFKNLASFASLLAFGAFFVVLAVALSGCNATVNCSVAGSCAGVNNNVAGDQNINVLDNPLIVVDDLPPPSDDLPEDTPETLRECEIRTGGLDGLCDNLQRPELEPKLQPKINGTDGSVIFKKGEESYTIYSTNGVVIHDSLRTLITIPNPTTLYTQTDEGDGYIKRSYRGNISRIKFLNPHEAEVIFTDDGLLFAHTPKTTLPGGNLTYTGRTYVNTIPPLSRYRSINREQDFTLIANFDDRTGTFSGGLQGEVKLNGQTGMFSSQGAQNLQFGDDEVEIIGQLSNKSVTGIFHEARPEDVFLPHAFHGAIIGSRTPNP